MVGKVERRKFTIVGEAHPDGSIAELIVRLCQTGDFSSLYLEALWKGLVNKRGDALKDKSLAYGFYPPKYDLIIEMVLRTGLQVHGLITKNESRDSNEVASWADYLIGNQSQGNKLIVIGALHANQYNYDYSDPEHSSVLPVHLKSRGIDGKDIFIVSELVGAVAYIMDDVPSGLYR